MKNCDAKFRYVQLLKKHRLVSYKGAIGVSIIGISEKNSKYRIIGIEKVKYR